MARIPGRPGPESTLDDVRDRLVDTAIDKLSEVGIEIGLSHLKLSEIIAAAGIARATAYRSLAHETLAPQARLHRDVLTHLLSRNTREANRSIVLDAVTKEIEIHADNMASDDIARRTAAMRAVIRAGGDASYRSVSSTRERAILTAAYGALQSSGADDWRHDELVRGEQGVTSVFGTMYTELSAVFGYQLKADYTMLQFSTAGAGLVEGLAMRHGVSDGLEGIKRPTGPDGQIEEWSLYAVCFEGLYTQFFEPISNEPFADLLRF